MAKNPIGRRAVLLVLMCMAPTACVSNAQEPKELLADAKSDSSPPKYTNRLAKEKSPYLLQHAHNPVDWYPWGEEAFAKARREGKPIFLSVGYSTCHWCHVMERESFANEEVAEILNERFVPVKVDREERPDVDRVYMAYVHASTGSGGWPMTVILTPELKPFFGGTYFPAEDKYGKPGVKRLLNRIAELWAKDRKSLEETAESSAKQLAELTAIDAGHGEASAVERELLERAAKFFASRFDKANGGFGQAPKFPSPVELNFLLTYSHRANNAEAREMALATLRAMAAGGIRDHLGGGFHRYSTDERWFLPHFEKMLYDQAQLAGVYLDAYQSTRDEQYADVAREIFEYVLRDLTAPEGRFYSAEDADSAPDAAKPHEKREGAFYVWTAAEIDEALGVDAGRAFREQYGVKASGNVDADPHEEFTGRNVLFAAKAGEAGAGAGAKFAEARAKLFAIRAKRPRPHLDDKTIVAWNGLMISSLARGGLILKEPRYTAAAVKAASFIRDKLYDAKTHELTRVYREGPSDVAGFLDDYAFFIEATLDLYESTLDVQWLRLALDLQTTQDRIFGDETGGGYFSTAGSDKTLLLRMKDDSDNVEPSGNSVAARNLLRLAQMTDDKRLVDRAEKTINVYAASLQKSPALMPRMLVAIDFHLDKPKQIVIAGDRDGADTRAMLEAVYATFLPNRVILASDGGDGQAFLAKRLPFIEGMKPISNRATAYVCENYACQRPTSDISVLEKQLAGAGGSSGKAPDAAR